MQQFQLEVGKHYNVTVINIVRAGVIVEIDGTNHTELIHVSKLSDDYVKNISDIVEIGMSLDALCIEGTIPGRLELSVKHLKLHSLYNNVSKSNPKHKHSSKKNCFKESNKHSHKQSSSTSSIDNMIAAYNKECEDRQRHLKNKPTKRKRHHISK